MRTANGKQPPEARYFCRLPEQLAANFLELLFAHVRNGRIDIVDVVVPAKDLPGDTKCQLVFDDRRRNGKGAGFVLVGSDQAFNTGFGGISRIFRLDDDGSRERVASLKRRLRTTQYFDLLDVPEASRPAPGCLDTLFCAVHDHRNHRVRAARSRYTLRAQTADDNVGITSATHEGTDVG